MRSACLVRRRFILNNFSGIGLGVPGPPGPPLGYAPGWVKIGDFRQITGYISKTVKDKHIVSVKVE